MTNHQRQGDKRHCHRKKGAWPFRDGGKGEGALFHFWLPESERRGVGEMCAESAEQITHESQSSIACATGKRQALPRIREYSLFSRNLPGATLRFPYASKRKSCFTIFSFSHESDLTQIDARLARSRNSWNSRSSKGFLNERWPDRIKARPPTITTQSAHSRRSRSNRRGTGRRRKSI